MKTNICKNCGKEFFLTKQQELNYKKYNKLVQYCSINCGKVLIQNYLETTNLKRERITEELGISMLTYETIAKKYNLKRTKEQIANLKVQNMKNTMQEKYGVTNPMDKEEFRQAISNSHNNRTKEQVQESSNKRRQTKLEKYGDENYHNIEQAKQTMTDRYGVQIGYQTEKAVKNRIESSIEKYGVDNPFKSKEVHELAKQKIQEIYGTNSSLNDSKVREKIKQTNLKKYGYENAMSAKNIQNKHKQNMLRKYGVTTGYLTENGINSHKFGTISKINKKFVETLKSHIPTIEVKLEKAIGSYCYDICINDQLLIDINPTISHNSTYSYPFYVGMKKENNPVSNDYHHLRCINALENGYELISIFDWMEEDKIIDIIKARLKLLNNRVFGNKCVIKEINQTEANKFLDLYHLQGKTNGQEVCVGLFYNNELVQVQTFGKPRFNKEAEWEAIRLASKADTYIIGGVSKGFKYFVDKYKPNSIISYNSLNISSGHTDDMQGFKLLGYSKSQGIWVNMLNNNNPFTIRDASLRKQGIDRLLNRPAEDFPDYDGTYETSNEYLIILEGYVKVYDCGNITYLWSKDT